MINEEHRKAVYDELKRVVKAESITNRLRMSLMTARQLFGADNDPDFEIETENLRARFCLVTIDWSDIDRIELWTENGALLYSIKWVPDPDKKAKLIYSGPQAMRFNEGKLEWSLIDFKQLEGMVRVLQFGAKKYSQRLELNAASLFQLCQTEHVSSVAEKSDWLRGPSALDATLERDILRLSVEDVDALASLGAKAFAPPAMKLPASSLPLNRSNAVDSIRRLIEKLRILLQEKEQERNADPKTRHTLRDRREESFFVGSTSTESQKSFIGVGASGAARYVEKSLTHTLITTIPLASSEAFFVASATKRSDCFRMTFNFFKELSLISSEARFDGSEFTIPGRDNWKKGLPMRAQCESMMRHLVAIMSGEVKDKETGEYHWHCIQCNAMFMGHTYENHPKHIDLPIPEPNGQ